MLDQTVRADDRATRRFIAYQVERAHAKLTIQATRVLAAHCGLTPRQWWIIADMMAEAPETASELAMIGDMDPGQLSRNMKMLVDAGYVETRGDARDRRRQIISLTDAGRAVHDETIPVMAARNRHLVAGLAEQELEVGLRVLRRLEAAAAETSFSA